MQSVQINQWIKIFDIMYQQFDTWDHSKRVAKMISRIDLPKKQLDKLFVAALFHDIGCFYNILERDKNHDVDHSERSYFLFLKIHADHEVAELIRHHHCFPESYQARYDESKRGYPEETCELLKVIPPSLQILQICNEYDNLKTLVTGNNKV
jgi:response regulator RpfG family c-di-GMP phosphodiesterase